jgi:hypothetical protein
MRGAPQGRWAASRKNCSAGTRQEYRGYRQVKRSTEICIYGIRTRWHESLLNQPRFFVRMSRCRSVARTDHDAAPLGPFKACAGRSVGPRTERPAGKNCPYEIARRARTPAAASPSRKLCPVSEPRSIRSAYGRELTARLPSKDIRPTRLHLQRLSGSGQGAVLICPAFLPVKTISVRQVLNCRGYASAADR